MTSPKPSHINGVKIVDVSPAKLPAPVTGTLVEVRGIEELLLEDGGIKYRCASVRNPECPYTADSGESVRSHLKSHSDRVELKRAEAELKKTQSELARLQKQHEEERAKRSAASKKAYQNRKPKDQDTTPEPETPTEVIAVEASVEVFETLNDLEQAIAVAEERVAAAKVYALQLREALKDVELATPEIINKAKKYDAMVGLLKAD